MRYILPVIGLALLAACDSTVPESGVGFEDYDTYLEERRRRDAELQRRAAPNRPVVSDESPDPSRPVPAPTTAGETHAVRTNNPGISDSQDFEAVSARETIESDAEKLRRQREQYEFADPKPVPKRSGRANIAEFALSTTHSVGEKRYSRSTFGGVISRVSCGRYSTDDDAQQAFLEAGGPERDRLGLDPDGDGFACSWSPEVFRRMVN